MFFGRRVSPRYVRHKVVASLVTFALLWIVLKAFFPDNVLDEILKNLVDRTPSPEEVFAERDSGVAIEVVGVVAAVLTDSLSADEGARPIQRLRFLSHSGHPLTLVHDLALAPRASVSAGDTVSVRGCYVWNTQGGLLLTAAGEGEAPGWIRPETAR